jgi:hypothetical protein
MNKNSPYWSVEGRGIEPPTAQGNGTDRRFKIIK